MDWVSVIIPVYNVENYIERCVTSVINQTYKNLEIIIIDDGSTDSSFEICKKLGANDTRIKIIQQSNSGVSVSRNTGLKNATGEYILQVDSDDFIAPYTVEHLLNVSRDNQADIVICDFVRGSDSEYNFPADANGNIDIVSSKEVYNLMYKDSHHALRYVVPWCKLYKRNLFQGIEYPDGKIFEDIYVTHKVIFKCKKIALLNEELFYYFYRSNSLMNMEFNLAKLDYLPALVERIDFFKENGMDNLSEIAYDELLHSLIWEYSRTRDMLHSKVGLKYVKKMFRQNYRKGYASKRYPDESKIFLSVFNFNPELIVLYWKISGKLGKLLKRKK